jgi:hypothetical protein
MTAASCSLEGVSPDPGKPLEEEYHRRDRTQYMYLNSSTRWGQIRPDSRDRLATLPNTGAGLTAVALQPGALMGAGIS